MRTTERVTLHFDLSHCPKDAELTLRAGGGRKFRLTRYSDAPGKLDEHREKNRALGLLGKSQLARITHFAEDAELFDDCVSMRSVIYPAVGRIRPLPELAVVFMHIPIELRRRALHKMQRRGTVLPHPLLLAHYGVPHASLQAMSAADLHQLHLDASLLKGPYSTAETLVFQHPEIGTLNPDIATQVFTGHIKGTQAFSDLIQYISSHPPEDPDSWYQQKAAEWMNPETKVWEPAPPAEAVDKNGERVQWPIDPTSGKEILAQYDLTDEAQADGGVLAACTPVVHEVLIGVKNDGSLNGQLWTKQSGTTSQVQTEVPPSRPAARAQRAALAEAPKGWTVKNQTSSYGLELYADSITFDAGKISFPVKNWPNRYLGAYVQFLKADGTPIPRGEIPGWQDDLPEFLRDMFEHSPNKNYLAWISPGNQVFGIPFPTNPVPLTFVWPQDATHAVVMVGGLGCASGFTDWDSEVDVLGVVSTGLITFGLTAASMVLSVYVIGPLMSMITGPVLYAIYGIAAAVGVAGVIYGSIEHDTSTGKSVLRFLANKVASVFFSQIVKVGLQKIYQDAVQKLIAEYWGLVTAEEALEQIPTAGWVLKIASVAADIAALAATTVECVLSPATYQLAVLRTMTLHVTVKPDPAHGKADQDPIWPLVADHYVIMVTYPKTGSQDGGTTYALAGPMPGSHTAAIEVSFLNIPAGGKCNVTANIYSANDWLAGQWSSGWINAIPDANAELSTGGAIKEALVPLTATTSYSQKQRVRYDGTEQKHLWQVTKFSIAATLAGDLDAGTVSDALRSAFLSNGNVLSRRTTVKPIATGSSWSVNDPEGPTTFAIDKVQIYDGDGTPQYQLAVQNQTNASPALPATLNDCTTAGTNHNMCSRVNITINNKEYQLGYSWQASGQNLPLDDGTTPSNVQMFAFQSISTLGQPQDQIIEPARGFSQQAMVVFDQFGLTPLFDVNISYAAKLDGGAEVPPDIAKALAAYDLPASARVTVVTKGQEWTIGAAGTQLFTLRVVDALINGAWGKAINVYSYPVPAIDNYWVDPRTYSSDGKYHLRGVTFPKGASQFDYAKGNSWGAFTQPHLNSVAVHPHGYAVGADFANHKLFVLRLPPNAVPEAQAPLAMPLSGQGTREGLMLQPVALTITADGRILVLEQGNKRVQAFDVKGNPVPSFKGPGSFTLDKSFAAVLDSRTPNTALMQAMQRSVSPAVAPLLAAPASSAAALDQGKADDALRQAFTKAAYALPEDAAKVSVTTTTAGSLWLLTNKEKAVTYDVRLDGGELSVHYAFALSITVNAPGTQWRINDATSALTFDVKNPPTGPALTAQQLIATMAVRDQSPDDVSYLDIAVEDKGYIYVLASVAQRGAQPRFQLDLYNPDGTVLLGTPQTGVNAAKLAVDRWRTLFTLNYETILGPGARTEPGVSAWIPSTPGAPK